MINTVVGTFGNQQNAWATVCKTVVSIVQIVVLIFFCDPSVKDLNEVLVVDLALFSSQNLDIDVIFALTTPNFGRSFTTISHD